MGLASSQARLLSLTQRQHSVEHRAQYLQAQKVRLAMDSDAVYEKFVNALDATKIQAKSYTKDGKVKWIDANVNNLMHTDAAYNNIKEALYVQDVSNGKLYIPEKFAKAYDEAAGDILKFTEKLGQKGIPNSHNEDYLIAEENYKYALEKGWDKIDMNLAGEYMYLVSEAKNPTPSSTYNAAKVLESLSSLQTKITGIDSKCYISKDTNLYNSIKNALNTIKASEYFNNNASYQNIINYITNSDGFESTFSSNSETKTIDKLKGSLSSTDYISYDSTKNSIDTLTNARLSILLNGGDFEQTSTLPDGSTSTEKGNVYSSVAHDYQVTNSINNISVGSTKLGDALVKMGEYIKEQEYEKNKQNAKTNLSNFLTNNNQTHDSMAAMIDNHNKYEEYKNEFFSANQETYTKYENQILGEHYENIFNAINAAGGYIQLTEEQAKNGSWLTNMVKNSQVILTKLNKERANINYNTDASNVNKDEFFYLSNIAVASNVNVREISNDKEIAKAEVEYETSLDEITDKETKITTQLNRLESEKNAIQTEIESLKKIANDNITSTFKIFS